MGAVSAPRLLSVLALTAVLAAGCGSGSSSNDSAASGGDSTTAPAASGSLELRPVYARYAKGVPLGDSQLGPTVPKALLSAMQNHDCSAKPSELQGMLLVCGTDHTVYLLKDPIVDGGVATATPSHIAGQKDWYLKVGFDQQAAGTLADATRTMAGTELAIVLEDRVLSAPIVDSSMADGHVVITGDLDEAQATRLADRLKASSS
jgi:preprotein translocase subunit SecD